ncbi:MAG TPA: peptidylprolyl isomerase [Verrucomicrobiae bacterium]|jgi:cyclophilin family peptidyl-prolyl cis-trans isomerase|nr:peptidylprolyl isomerase [Verrucomicrobiae bacterium]
MKNLHCLVVLLLCAFAAKSSLAGSLVIFHITLSDNTSVGDIEVELYDKDKPVTVKNFLRYVEDGYYQNSFLHRCPLSVSGVTDFVIQGGAFAVQGTGTNETIVGIPSFAPIPDEFAVGTRYSNTYGTIAMAKLGGDTNSATSSWFFNLTNNASLDAADTNDLFTVFGHVVRGTNVLNGFIGRSYGNGLQDLGSPLDSLPVNFSGFRNVFFSDLYYVNISILNPQLKLLTNGARQISWSSINGLTNALEYTTNLPPVWQTLTNIVGTGAVVTNTDSATNLSSRFYRVQILY